jgi:nitroimidazol reductase NimA-like FMN-containing flavoprotein (pyridoxamine 5'-phosphate oxidase superfamily)
MLGKLNDIEKEEILKRQIVGRIGCHAAGVTYVVPVSYAYDGKDIYVHTYEGMKLEMMRVNPHVCFETDVLKDMANWQSVITWGEFEELTEPTERNKALQILLNRKLPLLSSITTHLSKDWPFSPDDLNKIEGTVFRIALKEKHGRFESSAASPLFAG